MTKYPPEWKPKVTIDPDLPSNTVRLVPATKKKAPAPSSPCRNPMTADQALRDLYDLLQASDVMTFPPMVSPTPYQLFNDLRARLTDLLEKDTEIESLVDEKIELNNAVEDLQGEVEGLKEKLENMKDEIEDLKDEHRDEIRELQGRIEDLEEGRDER